MEHLPKAGGRPSPRDLKDEIADTVSRVRTRSAGLIARAAEEGWSDGRLHQEIRHEFERPETRASVAPRPGRYRVDIPVDCSTRGAFISNRVTNISRGGLFIQSSDPLPLQAEVDLALRLPETGVTIQATGRVIWNYDVEKGSSRIVPGSGIKFIDLSPENKARLEACLARLAAVASPEPRHEGLSD